jgi:hypothetical protein
MIVEREGIQACALGICKYVIEIKSPDLGIGIESPDWGIGIESPDLGIGIETPDRVLRVLRALI